MVQVISVPVEGRRRGVWARFADMGVIKKMLVLTVVALIFTSCGDSDRPPAETTVAAVTTSTVTSTTVAPTITTMATTTSTAVAITTTTDPPKPTAPALYEAESHDPPIGETSVPMLLFDNEAAYRFVGGQLTFVAEGPFDELFDDGSGGIVFQRESKDSVIWWLPSGATTPQELLVVEEPMFLILEGVTGGGAEVLYQRVLRANPENSIETLRSYRFADGVVSEIEVTGGWESLTKITSVVGRRVAGTWSSEALGGYFFYDLDQSRSLLVEVEPEEEGTNSRQIAIIGDRLLGVGFLGGAQMDMYPIDRSSNLGESIVGLAWNNGLWYPTGLFVVDGYAVMSRGDVPDDYFEHPADPEQGPVVIDLATGDAITLPFAANARSLAS